MEEMNVECNNISKLKSFSTSSESQDEMEGGLLLDIVVYEGSALLQLLSGKDKSLLIRGDALLILNPGLDVLNAVGVLVIQGDDLASEGLDEMLKLKACV